MQKTIGENIMSILERKQMTQKELAKEIGVGPAMIHRYIHDTAIPTLFKVIDIAEALNVTIDEVIYGRTEDKDYEGIKRNLIRQKKNLTTMEKLELCRILIN